MTETIFFESTLPLSHAFSYQKNIQFSNHPSSLLSGSSPDMPTVRAFFLETFFAVRCTTNRLYNSYHPTAVEGLAWHTRFTKNYPKTFHDECRGHGIGIIFSKGAPNTAGFFSAANGRFKISSLRSFPRVIEFLLLLQVLSSAQIWSGLLWDVKKKHHSKSRESRGKMVDARKTPLKLKNVPLKLSVF